MHIVLPQEEVLSGGFPLSEEIRIMRNGGHSVQTRQLGDTNYDEDDVKTVDPPVDSLDKFERAQAITDQIPERVESRKKEQYPNCYLVWIQFNNLIIALYKEEFININLSFAMGGITNNLYPEVKLRILRKNHAFYLAISKSLFNFA